MSSPITAALIIKHLVLICPFRLSGGPEASILHGNAGIWPVELHWAARFMSAFHE
jgi:hypothetical protein